MRIFDADGRVVPAQLQVEERWGDASIRWLLARFAADTDSNGVADYQLVTDGSAAAQLPVEQESMHVDARDDVIEIDTGAITATVGDRIDVSLGGAESSLSVRLTDIHGERRTIAFDRRDIADAGLLYVRVELRTSIVDGAQRASADLMLRLEFFAGLPVVRCALALTNPRRAAHPGGIWELGDPDSLWLREATVRVDAPARADGSVARWSVSPHAGWREDRGDVAIYQESPVACVSSAGARIERGQRGTPVLQIVGSDRSVAMTAEQFWENAPKQMRAAEGALWMDLFPARAPEAFELQPGERKTHTFMLSFGADGVSSEPLAWARDPLLVSAAPATYLASEPLPFLSVPGEDAPGDDLLDGALTGPHSFFQKREDAHEYGWRDFGDLYADHEAVNAGSLVSHYNNQYDAIAGFAAQYFRSGDSRWWTLMDDLARHVADIDIYHTVHDKAAYSGGLFWHTFHYMDAGRSTHRSYPRHPGVNGGGPSAEHNYSTGLMLHSLLTGSPDTRDAAIGLAEWVLRMDRGSATPWHWLSSAATGNASATGSFLFHGPGRGAGNSIAVLITASRLSAEPRFLREAERLIARCIHPSDDIEALNLLDAEQRWSYTVFLQALGRYLFHKADLAAIDGRYAYARASLLHYVRWMADHERPYLDHPEQLEYPTETWAAQDLRKAEVFVLGSLVAGPGEHERFLSRAEYYHAHAVALLERSGTVWLTRPTVILLSTLGAVPWARRWAHPHLLPEAAPGRWPPRRVFVPQRVEALRRAALAACACAVGGMAAAAALLRSRGGAARRTGAVA